MRHFDVFEVDGVFDESLDAFLFDVCSRRFVVVEEQDLTKMVNYRCKLLALFKIKFITKELFTRYTNIRSELNWKLFTKVIKTKQRSLGLFRQTEFNTEKRKCFNLERIE